MTRSTALVTGATGGIGLQIAQQFAELGWMVLIGARDAARGAEVAARFGGRPVLLDVTDADTIAKAAATVSDLDVLVNNAGISLDIGTPVTEADVDVFRRTYETNVFGLIAVTNAFLPALRRSTHPRIVNVSSGTGSLTWSTGPNPQFDFRRAGTGRGAAYVLQDCRRRADRLLRASTRRGRRQGECSCARPARDEPQSPGRGRRRPGRSGRWRHPACATAGRRPHRPAVLMGRDGRTVVNARSAPRPNLEETIITMTRPSDG